MTRTDWTAPHWEHVALEQVALGVTVGRRGDRVMIIRSPHGGRARLRDPETGRPLLTTGDVAAFGPHRVLRLYYGTQWHLVPSHEAALRWTLDGLAESPDGRTVEPDAPDSWLALLGLV